MHNKQKEKEIKVIAIYARVSTSNQENEGTIETQLSAIKQFSKEKGYTIVQEYLDNGWSGDSLARPSLDQMREDSKKKIWEAVLAYDPDRIARRYSYQELIMDELREAGTEVLFVTTSSPKNSEDKILHGVRGLFAEYERAKIAERFRLGKLRKIKEGHILVSEPLYGYKYVCKENNTHGYYEINPDEARIMKMIFEWVANDRMTLRGVVKKLRDLNIKPRKSKRGVWSTSTLSSQLKNKAYIGEAHWGTTYATVPENPLKIEKYKKIKKTSRKKKEESDWYSIPVPAIIEKNLFEKARTQLSENFKLCIRNKKNDYLVGNKIFCTCGSRRNGEGPKQGKHLYYRCSDRVRCFPLKSECKEKGINAKIADQLIWEKISTLMTSEKLMKDQLQRWFKNKNNRSLEPDENIELINKEIEKLKVQEERYSKAYAAGLFEIDTLKSHIQPIKEKILSLGKQLQDLKEKAQDTNITIPDDKQLSEYAGKATESLKDLNFIEKREIVLSIIEKVVGTKEELTVTGLLPIKSPYVEYKTINRYGQDANQHLIGEKYVPFEFKIRIFC